MCASRLCWLNRRRFSFWIRSIALAANRLNFSRSSKNYCRDSSSTTSAILTSSGLRIFAPVRSSNEILSTRRLVRANVQFKNHCTWPTNRYHLVGSSMDNLVIAGMMVRCTGSNCPLPRGTSVAIKWVSIPCSEKNLVKIVDLNVAPRSIMNCLGLPNTSKCTINFWITSSADVVFTWNSKWIW